MRERREEKRRQTEDIIWTLEAEKLWRRVRMGKTFGEGKFSRKILN